MPPGRAMNVTCVATRTNLPRLVELKGRFEVTIADPGQYLLVVRDPPVGEGMGKDIGEVGTDSFDGGSDGGVKARRPRGLLSTLLLSIEQGCCFRQSNTHGAMHLSGPDNHEHQLLLRKTDECYEALCRETTQFIPHRNLAPLARVLVPHTTLSPS